MPFLHLLLAAWLGGQCPAADPSAIAGSDAGCLLQFDAIDFDAIDPTGLPSGVLVRPASAVVPHRMAALLGEQDETEDGNDALANGSSAGPRLVPLVDERAPRWPLSPYRRRFSDRSAALRC